MNRFPEVNHNYEREHRHNLWFVVTAGSAGRPGDAGGHRKRRVIPAAPAAGRRIPHRPRLPAPGRRPEAARGGRRGAGSAHRGSGRRLVSVLQEGLPLFIRPFALIAERIGASEHEVLARIGRWLEDVVGAIRGFGVVVWATTNWGFPPTPWWSTTFPTTALGNRLGPGGGTRCR